MAQGKAKFKQRPGDSSKKSKQKHQGAVAKKKGTLVVGSSKASSSTITKANLQKAINARIEAEVGERAKACESKSFKLLNPGGTGPNYGGASKSKSLHKQAKAQHGKKTKRK